ncbi:MAG: branched-chain amino acid ABC transporter permease [Ilumatobacteraceae bacterium]
MSASQSKRRVSNGAAFMIAVMVPITIFLIVQLFSDPAIFLTTILKSLAMGSTYAIIALGFVLIFKATEVVNFSQGALAMIGALFISFLVADETIPIIPWWSEGNLVPIRNPIYDLGLPSWMAWGLSFIVALFFAALIGLFLERVAIRPMIGQPLFSVAVITLGLEIALRIMANDSAKLKLRNTNTPWSGKGFNIGDNFLYWSFFAAMIAAAISVVAVFLFYRSKLGIAMRAVARDQEAAMAQGIPIGRVFAIAWGAGAALAAVGGLFATEPPIKQTGAVDAETSLVAFRALPAVILGGLDSVQGAILGGLIVGSAEIFAGQYLSGYNSVLGSGYPLVVPYVVMIIGLIVKPYGLFGTEEIRRV